MDDFLVPGRMSTRSATTYQGANFGDIPFHSWLIFCTGQDEHAISNYLRAHKAIQAGWFADEISPVTIIGKKGNTIVADDEEPSKVNPKL